MNYIPQIDKIKPIAGLAQPEAARGAQSGQGESFASIFQSAIREVRETDAEKNELEYLLATGQLENPAMLSIASAKNELAVSMLVQLRNRALEAYSELTRISM